MNGIVLSRFLEEEEICGHLVTTETKKLWATQLGCLHELDRICKKHNITYFACGGTLLGAIRHKGFIPWDDDIDVAMFYQDYEKFCQVAPKEIAHPFFFQNYKTEPGFGPAMSRIRNSNTTGCTSYDMKMRNEEYNCGLFLDIFPLFGVEDASGKQIQKWQVTFWKRVISGYELKRMSQLGGFMWIIRRWAHPYIWLWNIMSIFVNHAEASKRLLKACASAKSYKRVGLLSFTGYNPRLIWDKDWFAEMIILPFEYTDIPCPSGYDKILCTQYGDYLKFVKGGQIHTMVVCDPDTPFKVKLAGCK